MPTEQKSIKKTYLTIDDIAAMAGVSKSTVSRVLNNSGFVSEKTRTKVMDIVEANHYIPNSMARELGRTSTQSIGIFIGNISNSYYSEILSGAEAAINRSAFFPFICVVSNERREEFYVQEMLKRRTSGILFASTTIYNLDAIAQLLRSTHAISIQTDIPHVPRIDCENRLGTQRIVEHLIALGHQKIAFLTFQNPTMVLSQRFEGYCRALEEHDLPVDPRYVKRLDRVSSGYQAVLELLSQENPPTAIHCCNDHIAESAYQALRNYGVSIPGDISLTGFDAVSNTLLMEPQLTTVSQPLQKMGEKAVEMLLLQLSSPAQVPESYRFPTEILLRGSTAPPPAHPRTFSL